MLSYNYIVFHAEIKRVSSEQFQGVFLETDYSNSYLCEENVIRSLHVCQYLCLIS